MGPWGALWGRTEVWGHWGTMGGGGTDGGSQRCGGMGGTVTGTRGEVNRGGYSGERGALQSMLISNYLPVSFSQLYTLKSIIQ